LDLERLAHLVSAELQVRPAQVASAIALLDDGNTIPFVARYRKEATGNLDEEQLRAIEKRVEYLRHLAERQETALRTIAEQGKLTDELRGRIEGATTLQEVEDLYLPYRPKRRTRATIARERGLEPLAEIMQHKRILKGTPQQVAAPYCSEAVPTPDDALQGARDIIAEIVAEEAEGRSLVRAAMQRAGLLATRLRAGAEDAEAKYRDFYEYAERLAAMPPHRILAVNRGEKEGVLTVTLQLDDDALIGQLQARHAAPQGSILAGQVAEAVADGYQRLMRPALEREVRAARTAEAEAHATHVFGANLRALLLQPPLGPQRVLAIDPGFRTGSKVAIVDETGRYLAHTTIYPHAPQGRWEEAKETLRRALAHSQASVIAIGNGTASRETEALAAELIAEGADCAYVMVSEAGASVYSASKLAGQELPQLDVSIRGAVSIARRLQDPLAELVKIEPRSIGVGLYQHDVDQKELAGALTDVVESAVNHVGVNLNTASPALLQYVSGISARVAGNVVAKREELGRYSTRRQLLEVTGLGPKAFEQCAGFLKVPGGTDPLDSTTIHPESYGVCHQLLGRLGLTAREADLGARVRERWSALLGSGVTVTALAKELGCGVPTLEDMVANLLKPGRDPRDELPAPLLRRDVLHLEDLQEGMVLKGTVRNVVDFGAFVDIGVKHDGLVHVSELADRFVRNPLEVVSVGDVVDVRVLSVDLKRNRIALSMKGLSK
jgi:uncharacterized protein